MNTTSNNNIHRTEGRIASKNSCFSNGNYETIENAFQSTVEALAIDMPILMHGAGDVGSDSVDPVTVQLLSTLTAQYISRFVDAAIDSREMLLDHPHLFFPRTKQKEQQDRPNSQVQNHQQQQDANNNTRMMKSKVDGMMMIRKPEPPLPPPSFQRSRKPPIPSSPQDDYEEFNNHRKETTVFGKSSSSSDTKKRTDQTMTTSDGNVNDGSKNSDHKSAKKIEMKGVGRKRKRFANIEYWDDPLPEPVIRPRSDVSNNDNIEDAKNNNENNVENPSNTDNNDDDIIKPDVHVDEWVGAVGVDLLENRCRSAYVRGPAAITTQSFIFPICHDTYVYGRIREMQNAKRTTYNNLLTDQIVLDLIRTEGRNYYKNQNKKKSKNKYNNNGSANHKNKKKAAGEGTGSDADEEDGEDDNNQNNDDDDQDDDMDGDDEDGQPMWPGLDFILPVHRW